MLHPLRHKSYDLNHTRLPAATKGNVKRIRCPYRDSVFGNV
jgi:hypothetical protein